MSNICVCDQSRLFPRCDRCADYCTKLKQDSDIDWKKQNEMRKKWLKDNPDAKYEGWMSI